MTFHENAKTARDAIEKVIEKGEQLYNVRLPTVSIRFDLKGRAAGIAGHKNGQYYIRLNATMMTGDSWAHILEAVIPHEVAHLFCFANPNLGSNHNKGWKSVCISLGGTGSRTHSEPVIYARGKTYEYITDKNHAVMVSETIHKKIHVRGISYTWKSSGKSIGTINSSSKFKLVAISGQKLH